MYTHIHIHIYIYIWPGRDGGRLQVLDMFRNMYIYIYIYIYVFKK